MRNKPKNNSRKKVKKFKWKKINQIMNKIRKKLKNNN